MNKERGLFGLWLSASAKATVDGCFDSVTGFFKRSKLSPLGLKRLFLLLYFPGIKTLARI